MEGNLYLIYPIAAESGALETLPETENLILIEEREFIKKIDDLSNKDKICITSEASLNIALQSINDKKVKQALEALKDKFLFRQLLKELYPSVRFQNIGFKDIQNLKIEKKMVLKPSKGCFGTAVKIIDNSSNLELVASEIQKEISKNSDVLSESVLSKDEFILEDFIEGEEYAVDMFYDSNGNPHIVNIYYHPIPKNESYLHMIYYTNKSIFEKVYDRAILFFERLNNKIGLKNIALHSEFKFSDDLFPIEINAMRFGGMGLGNMIYHSLGINPYQYFINEKSPNWKEIWKGYPDSNFLYFIAYNGTDINKETQRPTTKRLESHFSKILNRTIFDYKSQLAFGAYTLEESSINIPRLLDLDFNDFFEDIK